MLINIPKDLGRPEPVMAGIYKVLISGCKVEKANTSDNMLIKPELTIQTQNDADGKKVAGRKLFDQWVVAESSLGIWNNHYKAITGHDLPSGSFELDEFLNRVTSDIQNREVLVQVEVRYSKKNSDGRYVDCDPNDPDCRAMNQIKRYTALAA